ncbi:MAG: helix-turn-helix domain-containing protein [Acidimicrobiales bacterium]|jgi:AcrR family transcriptional regulator
MGLALADRALTGDRSSIAGADADGFEPGVVAHGNPPSPRAADSRARVLAAALRCVARFGVSKTTVEDVAREARLSRATLYRVFPGGRDEIVETMIDTEVRTFFAALARRLEGVDDYEERIVVAMSAAAEQLVAHEALGFVLAHEPELVLPHVSFAELDHVLEISSAFLAPYLGGLLAPEDARRAGEWVTRLVLSHVACPSSSLEAPEGPRANSFRGAVGTPFALHPEPLSEDRTRWLVRTFVMPGIRALTEASSSAPSVPTS